MIYPLLPAFLITVLGASAGFLGVIEGAADSTASLLKLASGWWSDRVHRRKPLVVFGYTLASAVRPLVAIARAPAQVLAIRLSDRVGKGIRNSPRDALIADSVDPAVRGRAFGFQRAADNLGAFVGPVLAFAIMRWGHVTMRHVFLLAFVPGILAIVAVVFGVREIPKRQTEQRVELADREKLSGRFWAFLVVVFVFTLGNSSDAFLLLRAQQLGVAVVLAPILWAFLNVVKSLSNTPGGALSDRVGRKPTLIAGWLIYAAVYLGFALASDSWHAWALFGVYGIFFGLTEGSERALVSDVVPANRRGAAFGWYYLAIGLGALPASVIFGVLWDRLGSHVAFTFGALLALVSAIGVLFVPTTPPRRSTGTSSS